MFRNALILAAQNGHERVIELLLGKGIETQSKEQSGWTALHSACGKAHLEVVRKLLATGHFDVNIVAGPKSLSPLHLAIYANVPEIVKLLFSYIPNFEVREDNGKTPLWSACSVTEGDGTIAGNMLLDAGADPRAKDDVGNSCLHAAATAGSTELMSALLDRGAEINEPGSHESRPLHFAVQVEQSGSVHLLLERGADANAKDGYSEVPLHDACRKGNITIRNELLDAGADVNTGNPKDITPLHIAVMRGHLSIVRLLTERGANINSQDEDGDSALKSIVFSVIQSKVKQMETLGNEMSAADISVVETDDDIGSTILQGPPNSPQSQVVGVTKSDNASKSCQNSEISTQLEILQLLLQKGADTSLLDKAGQAPLHYAAYQDAELTKILLDAGADPTIGADDALSPFTMAINAQNLDTLTAILDSGKYNLNEQSQARITPLYLADVLKFHNVYDFLRSRGADLEAKNRDGETPLYSDVGSNEYESVSFFVSEGSDVNTRDNTNTPLLCLAAGKADAKIVELLLQHSADLHAKGQNGESAIHHAIGAERIDNLEVLLLHGAEVDARDGNGHSSLLLVFYHGREEHARFLPDHGADIEASDDNGTTPLLIAAKRGNEGMVQLLLERGANVDTKDHEGQDARSCAVKADQDGVITILDEFAEGKEGRPSVSK